MLGNSGVLVVLVNYARPQNMPAVILAWREQSAPPERLIVVDNSPSKGVESYPNLMALNGADDVWRWTANAGCACRFAPAWLLHGHKYVLFADDDYLPGSRAIENLLACAKKCEGHFATIGQFGRRFDLDSSGRKYRTGNLPRHPDVLTKCDLTCRAQFVSANFMSSVLQFRQMVLGLLELFPTRSADLVDIHDDMILCLGIQTFTGLPSYLTPFEENHELRFIKTELPEHGTAVWRRPGHFAERELMIDLAIKTGWRRPS